jgi:hypothetical protein
MKATIVGLTMVLACSCQRVSDNSTPGRYEDTMERREEVRTVISNFFHSNIDTIRGPLTIREVQTELAKAGRKAEEVAGWRELKAKVKRGDGIYFYRTDAQSWKELRGQQGYVAVRNRDVIGSLLTRVN